MAIYSCNSGYSLDGLERRTCQSDGQWLGIEPKCIQGKFIIIKTTFDWRIWGEREGRVSSLWEYINNSKKNAVIY